jgi:hypothetical protein
MVSLATLAPVLGGVVGLFDRSVDLIDQSSERLHVLPRSLSYTAQRIWIPEQSLFCVGYTRGIKARKNGRTPKGMGISLADGGATWTLALQRVPYPLLLTFLFCFLIGASANGQRF